MMPEDKYIYQKAQGNCMLPVIHCGDALVIKSAQKKDFKPGDIIAFSRGDNLFAHRLIKIIRARGQDLFLTKGDRDFFIEKPVEPVWVIGKVVAVTRNDSVVTIKENKMGFYNKLLFFWLAVYYFFITLNPKSGLK